VAWLIPPCSAAELELKQGRATLTIVADKIEAGKAEMRLSGTVRLAFQIDGPAHLEVEPLDLSPPSKDWKVGTRSDPVKTPLQDGQVRWRQGFVLAPMRAEELELPLPVLRFRDGDGEEWQLLRWQPLHVLVTTEIVRPDLSELRDDSVRPEELSPPTSWWEVLWKSGLLLAGLTVLAILGILFRRRVYRLPAVPPHQWALTELGRLQDAPLTTAAAGELFHRRLADILRSYLQMRFQLPAPLRTTAEFLESLRRSTEVPTAQQELLRAILERSDLVKFARLGLDPAESRALLASACRFVEETAKVAQPQPQPS
jgi:hypothetical protein